jgi:hypothetical protein
MDMRKYSGETFIKIPDVRGGPLQLLIAGIREGQYERPNLVLESGELLSLNATNNKILIRAYGPHSEDWIGKEIELFLGEVEYQKKMQEAVSVRLPVLLALNLTHAQSRPFLGGPERGRPKSRRLCDERGQVCCCGRFTPMRCQVCLAHLIRGS